MFGNKYSTDESTTVLEAPEGWSDPMLSGESTESERATPIAPDAPEVASTDSPNPRSASFGNEEVRYEPVEHYVHGEPFEIKEEEGYLFLTHPRWGVTGYGHNLLEAEQSLIEDAKIKAPAYVGERPDDLTDEALRMRDFMVEVLPYA